MREKAVEQSEQSERDKKNVSEDDVKKYLERIRTAHEETLAGGGAAIEAAETRLALVRALGVNKWAGRTAEIGDKRLIEVSESEQEDEDEKGRAKKRQNVDDKRRGREAAAVGDEKSGDEADRSDEEHGGGRGSSSGTAPQSERKKPVKKEVWFDRDKAVSRAERSASAWRTTQHKAAEKCPSRWPP